MDGFEGYEDIDQYLIKNAINDAPIKVDELNHIIEDIVAHTTLSRAQAQRVTELFFEEIRTNLLNNKLVSIPKFGRFASQKTNLSVRFVAHKSLLEKINER